MDTIPLHPKVNLNSLGVIGEHLFAATNQGVYRSTDSGGTWDSTVNGLSDSNVSSLWSISDDLWCGLSFGLWHSIDSGKCWNVADSGIENRRVSVIIGSKSLLFVATDSGVYRSTNNGITWISVGLSQDWIFSLYLSGNTLLAGAYTSGIWRSADSGKTWIQVGLNNASVDHLAVIDSTLFVSLTLPNFSATILRSSDKGVSWESAIDDGIEPYLFDPVSLLASSGPFLFTSASNMYFFARSTNAGKNWAPCTEPNYGGNGVSALLTVGNTIFAGSDFDRVFSSTDQGITWGETDKGISPSSGNSAIHAFAIIDSTLFAGTGDNGIFQSTDVGIDWSPVNIGISNPAVGSLAVMGSNIFAGTYPGGVSLSTDKGQSWSPVNTGLDSAKYVGRLLVVGKTIFAASWDSGLYVSANSGMSWERIDSGITNASIKDLAVIGGNLYVATAGSGIWHRSLSELIPTNSVATAVQPPANDLSVSPNPLSQSTTIHLPTAERSFVQITIVNLLGTTVARLFDGELEAGEHSFVWDAEHAAAGTYFCVVHSNEATQRVPIVLAR